MEAHCHRPPPLQLRHRQGRKTTTRLLASAPVAVVVVVVVEVVVAAVEMSRGRAGDRGKGGRIMGVKLIKMSFCETS